MVPSEEPIYESVSQTMIEGLEKLPFQVQIRYTGRDGLDYQRILTMDRPVTKDRKFAEQSERSNSFKGEVHPNIKLVLIKAEIMREANYRKFLKAYMYALEYIFNNYI